MRLQVPYGMLSTSIVGNVSNAQCKIAVQMLKWQSRTELLGAESMDE